MTEEKIIDGVNVAGCVRLQNDNISCDLGGECRGRGSCYYKQLKRLEHKYNEVLKLAKQNADSNEFCIQELEKELELFKDEYFNGLSNEQIVELAKKSIRLTTYNRELEKENEELKEEIRQLIYGKTLEKTYTLFGKPIKYWENLEKENEELKEKNKQIKHENNKLRKQNERLKEKLREVEDYPHLFKLSGKCFFDEARTCNYFNDFVEARQALEEIREAILDFIPKENYKFATSLHPEFYGLIEFIQDKINEVLESEGE